jgi:hypothetical protein
MKARRAETLLRLRALARQPARAPSRGNAQNLTFTKKIGAADRSSFRPRLLVEVVLQMLLIHWIVEVPDGALDLLDDVCSARAVTTELRVGCFQVGELLVQIYEERFDRTDLLEPAKVAHLVLAAQMFRNFQRGLRIRNRRDREDAVDVFKPLA